MDLLARILADRRDRLLVRLGCWLVCFSLVIGLMLPQQKAKAVVLVDDLIVTAAVFLSSCGLGWYVLNCTQNDFIDAVAGVLDDYLNTEFAGQSPLEWAGDIALAVSPVGHLLIPNFFAEKLAAFAAWTVNYLGITEESSIPILQTGAKVTLANGESYTLGTYTVYAMSSGRPRAKSFQFGDLIPMSDSVTSLPITDSISWTTYFYPGSEESSDSGHAYILDHNGNYLFDRNGALYNWPNQGVCFVEYNGYLTVMDCLDVRPGHPYNAYIQPESDVLVTDAGLVEASSVVIDASAAIDIPDTSTMADDDYISIGIGADAGIGLDALLGQILDAILANQLTATQEIVKAEEIDKPIPGEVVDVDSLGLPALGEALTTRFPFSIPWDFFRAVQLLAAPAKAPYFEVDFLEPLADKVGGWKGSTTVVLDFSEYAIIGQVCRWTSTIGFCLMLAGATKRLIWTA